VLTNPFDGKAMGAKGLWPNELDLGVSTACHVGFAIVLQKKTKRRKKVHCCCCGCHHSPHHLVMLQSSLGGIIPLQMKHN
jgi:hypothetical protein